MENSYFNGISCPNEYVLALKDTLNVITGKWKLAIVTTLLFEKKRFSDIQRMIVGITPRMLSKELKELEMNGVVVRKVYDSTPVLVEYELTDSGKKLKHIIDTLVQWGLEHREQAIAAFAEAEA
ncbi:winged helix-turn-helix transcriptional regulator [Robertkochia solimangrovi]|uniref:winged helix-turn-helix transcriptional regulator n=1 Tax=Robertkochia solimangrovi TaxID=2213046 RepID=UPI00117F785B|nr:helix-turn-helix domain-containing protein [Robertkochia solimangrovi]TRZ41296.1 transcriptional regulator [Robertkochia solimangrovi]